MLLLFQMGCTHKLFRHDNKNTNTLVAVTMQADAQPVTHIDVQDINRDGYPDILAGNYIYLNPMPGKDSTWEHISLNPEISRSFFLNVDNDGLPDIVGINAKTKSLTWIEALDPEGIHWTHVVPLQQTPSIHVDSFPLEGAIYRSADMFLAGFEQDAEIYTLNVSEKPEESAWSFIRLEPNDTKSYDTLSLFAEADFNKDGTQDKAVYSPTNHSLIITLQKP